jgi:uncharacterized protein (TIGR02300 family)
LGAKRTCPETGKKFYDLNKDPVVSPYTGKTYPRSFFEEAAPVKPRKESAAASKAAAPVAEVEEEAEPDAPQFVPLEVADGEIVEDVPEGEEIPDVPDVEVAEAGDDEEEVFLGQEEEDDTIPEVFGGEGEEEV